MYDYGYGPYDYAPYAYTAPPPVYDGTYYAPYSYPVYRSQYYYPTIGIYGGYRGWYGGGSHHGNYYRGRYYGSHRGGDYGGHRGGHYDGHRGDGGSRGHSRSGHHR